ncbi:MAG TPA: hypothetical protein VM537_31480 [Anaerolineae bacterium]|nr:hypothetical protein [Anaerolineae bacterium]
MSRCSATELARNECANWQGVGSCQGMDVRGEACNPLPRCLLRDGLPCKHFERRLLPLLKSYPKYHGADSDYIDLTMGAVLPDQLEGHPFLGHTNRYVTGKAAAERFCDCGAPLGPRKQACPECLRKRRRAQFRLEKQRQRTNG